MARSTRASTLLSIFILLLGTAAARTRTFSRRRTGRSSSATTGIAGSGVFSQGTKDRSVVKVSSSSKCSARASSKSWSDASSVWVAAFKDAITAACNYDTGRVLYAFDAVAYAYAEIALDASASCETRGSAYGCATASASGNAQAQATYSAFVEAMSSVNNQGCPCLNEVLSDVYTSAEAFGNVWAEVSGSVEASVCSEGDAKISKKSTLSCYAQSFANIWGQAVAQAWINSECDASNESYLCTDNCDGYPSCNQCKAEGYADAGAWAEAVIQVDMNDYGDCFQTTETTFGDVVTVEYPTDPTGRADKGGSSPVYTSAVCKASAFGRTFSQGVSNYASTYVSAFLSGCKEGHDTIPAEVFREASAVVDIYAEVLAECTTVGDGSLGCASAETFTAAYAEACASAVAEAWAKANVEEECGCQNAISDRTYADADAHEKIFAQAEAWVLADTGCISGDQTVQTDLYISCAADAFAAILSKAVGDALVKGQCTLESQASCEACKDDGTCDFDGCIKDLALSGSAEATAIADITLEYNPGYCDGQGFGGELLDSYFAAGKARR